MRLINSFYTIKYRNYSQLSLLFISLAFIFSGCNHSTIKNTIGKRHFHPTSHSKQFGLIESDDAIQIIQINKLDTNWGYTFYKDQKKPKIVVLSTVFAGFIELLGAQSQIVGLDKISFYSDSVLLQQCKQGSTQEIGEEAQIQLEKTLALKPDILICNSENFNTTAIGRRLERSGTKIICCNNFKEAHPLARAEWIKLFGAITGKLAMADSLFAVVKNNYNATLEFAKQQSAILKSEGKEKPTVLAEAMFGDTWFVPGGKSYTAQLIEDAGGIYCFSDLQPLFTYPKSLEDVLQVAKDADIWIHIGQIKERLEILQEDERYGLFKAFQNKQLFNNNKQENSTGGNAFWEKGVGRPDLILLDLYTIFKSPTSNTGSYNYYTKIQ
jgi:iron complex transport system substrate-binding protein